MRPGKKAQSRLNLTGLRADASCWDCIRWPAAAMSAKSPALSQRTREGQGTRCVAKAWASPLESQLRRPAALRKSLQPPYIPFTPPVVPVSSNEVDERLNTSQGGIKW